MKGIPGCSSTWWTTSPSTNSSSLTWAASGSTARTLPTARSCTWMSGDSAPSGDRGFHRATYRALYSAYGVLLREPSTLLGGAGQSIRTGEVLGIAIHFPEFAEGFDG